jgi:diaminopimelate epimerase
MDSQPTPTYNHAMDSTEGRPFLKMHGLGNDFVIVDARERPFLPSPATARLIADRHRGVGFDQLIVIEPARQGALARLRFWNADGSEAGACGNGSRCAAWLLGLEARRDEVRLETLGGLLDCTLLGGRRVAVDFGPARLDWRQVPLAREADTLHVPLGAGPLQDAACLSVGNPHATFFVADAEAVDLASLGPRLEHDAWFPERANIGVASRRPDGSLRVRVWERGVGITQACGTGASAAAVNAMRRGLVGRRVVTHLDGGPLTIEWQSDDHVVMAGEVSLAFAGSLGPELIATADRVEAERVEPAA